MTPSVGAFALPEEPESRAIEVIIFDQDPVSRHVLRTALSDIDGIDVVDAIDDVAAIQHGRLSGDVAVVSTAHERALDAARLFAGVDIRVLCLGVGWTRDRLDHMFRAGVAGCLLKEISMTRLAAAVRAVASGCVVLADELRDLQAGTERKESPIAGTPPERLVGSLTDRELEVLELLASGSSTAETAAQLSVSRATVKSHVSHALAKLGVRNRVEAVLLVRHLLDRHGTAVELLA